MRNFILSVSMQNLNMSTVYQNNNCNLNEKKESETEPVVIMCDDDEATNIQKIHLKNSNLPPLIYPKLTIICISFCLLHTDVDKSV